VGEIAHGAVSRLPPSLLYTMVARTGGYAYDDGVWDLSIVQGPFSVAPCHTLMSRFANFFTAVCRACPLLLGTPDSPPPSLRCCTHARTSPTTQHRRATPTHVSEWSCLSTAGGTPWNTRLGVWSRPPAQADPLARGKAGHRRCVPTAVPRCPHPWLQDHHVPHSRAVRRRRAVVEAAGAQRGGEREANRSEPRRALNMRFLKWVRSKSSECHNSRIRSSASELALPSLPTKPAQRAHPSNVPHSRAVRRRRAVVEAAGAQRGGEREANRAHARGVEQRRLPVALRQLRRGDHDRVRVVLRRQHLRHTHRRQ
jgi:hypothetical protein